jgi:methanogenic corrinoid protein MtbC1
VRTEQASATGDLVELVRDDWFDVIGFSVGSSDRLAELTACIRDIRRVSRNARIGVMVGGPVFLAHPNLVAQVGADATAADGAEAADKAAQLLDAMDPAG